MSLRLTNGELVTSLVLGVTGTAFIAFLYSLDPTANWPLLTVIGISSFGFSAYIFQNQRKNQKEWEKHPTTFPNQEGGGIIGPYIERPWYNELAELGQRYRKKGNKHKSHPKKS